MNAESRLAQDRAALAELRERFSRETDPVKRSEISDGISALCGSYLEIEIDDEVLAAFRASEKLRARARRAGS